MVGATLLVFTALTVFLSYVNFGSQKANVAVAMVVATFKAGLVADIFMHLSAEKKLIYRILIFTGFFVFGLFWLTYLALVRSGRPLKCHSKVFTLSSSLFRRCSRSAVGVWCLWVNPSWARRLTPPGAICSFVAAVVLIVYGCWF